jgi:hypothetical protein
VTQTDLPFLRAVSWFDLGYAELPPEDMLRRYESAWRWRGVLAEPSAEELSFIRKLAARYGTVIRDLETA